MDLGIFASPYFGRGEEAGLESAIANAENNHQLDVDRLIVAEATVGKSIGHEALARPCTGRVARIQKPFS